MKPRYPVDLSKLGRLASSLFLLTVAWGLTYGSSIAAVELNDNFNDANDVGWAKITDVDFPATYTFPPDSYGGKAYRLQGGGVTGAQVGVSTARVVAYRADRIYTTNFYVAADLLSWDAGYTNDQVFGLIARASDISSGMVNGATFTVRINRFSDAVGSRGQAQIYSFINGGVGAPAAQGECILIPGRAYRFTFSASNNVMTGAIYDLEDLTAPLTSMTGDDVYASFFGGPFPDPSIGGYSGIYNISLATDPNKDPRTDTTFDNFVASEHPPTNVPAPATPHGESGVAQVVNRSPASFKNFHPPASGIAFDAATLTTTNSVNTATIKLYLNGVDVSERLSVSGPTTNAHVTFSGLTANAVYDARIELEDVLGRKTTNTWTFDTFSDAYLASARAKTIECEDFDFSGGQFIDDPPPSGYGTNDYHPIFSGGSTVFNLGTGYLDQDAINGVDYFDYDNNPGNLERDFRFYDGTGTMVGTITHLYGDGVNFPGSILAMRSFDTQRQKYSNVSSNLHDYVVERTEGGEWLNYTRIFKGDAYYHAYLRYNSCLAQPLSLDQVSAGTITNHLGAFSVQASSAFGHYRYAPMQNTNGQLAAVRLSGTNTLRLTMTGPQNGSTKQRTALNYLVFVPALQLESAGQVAGPYTLEPNAALDLGNRRITLPADGSTRYYRLVWDHATKITKVSLTNGNVVLAYE